MQSSRFRSQFGPHTGGYNELGDGGTSSNSVPEEEEEEDESEWGLQKGMALFEVSAKDDTGSSPTHIAGFSYGMANLNASRRYKKFI